MTMHINTVYDFNRALALGPYAWPGGYKHYFVTADGATLCWDAVVENQRLIRDAIIGEDGTGGWQVVAMDINWEDPSLYCDHTGAQILPEYGAD